MLHAKILRDCHFHCAALERLEAALHELAIQLHGRFVPFAFIRCFGFHHAPKLARVLEAKKVRQQPGIEKTREINTHVE